MTRDRWATLVLVAFGVVLVGLVLAVPQASASFGYTQSVNISGVPTQIFDYVLKLNVSPSNFNYSQARGDGGDLRFFEADNMTPLDSWLVNWNVTNVSTVLVHVPFVPVGGKNITAKWGDANLTRSGFECYLFPTNHSVCDTGDANHWSPTYQFNPYTGSDAGSTLTHTGTIRYQAHNSGAAIKSSVTFALNWSGDREVGGMMNFFGASPENWGSLLSDATSAVSGVNVKWAGSDFFARLSTSQDFTYGADFDGTTETDGALYNTVPIGDFYKPHLTQAAHIGGRWIASRDGIVTRNVSAVNVGDFGGFATSSRASPTSDGEPIEAQNVYARAVPSGQDPILNFTGNVSSPPSPPNVPVLSGVVLAGPPAVNSLSWTASAGAVGYNLTRYDNSTGLSSVILLGPVTSYQEPSTTWTVTYFVQAWSGAGASAPSNNVTLRMSPIPFFGNSGSLYGGSKTVLASALGVSTSALDVLYGLLLVLLFAGAGFVFAKVLGAGAGAVLGLFIAIAAGMFPLWVIVFFVVLVAAGGVLAMRGGGAGGGV